MLRFWVDLLQLRHLGVAELFDILQHDYLLVVPRKLQHGGLDLCEVPSWCSGRRWPRGDDRGGLVGPDEAATRALFDEPLRACVVDCGRGCTFEGSGTRLLVNRS